MIIIIIILTSLWCSFSLTVQMKWHSNTPSKHVYPDNWPVVNTDEIEPDVTSSGCAVEYVFHDCIAIGIPNEFLKVNYNLCTY